MRRTNTTPPNEFVPSESPFLPWCPQRRWAGGACRRRVTPLLMFGLYSVTAH
jgi:hypothetical protein